MLLRAVDIILTEPIFGRILTSLKPRNLLINLLCSIPSRSAKTVRRYATQVPVDKRNPTASGWAIQIGTVCILLSAGP